MAQKAYLVFFVRLVSIFNLPIILNFQYRACPTTYRRLSAIYSGYGSLKLKITAYTASIPSCVDRWKGPRSLPGPPSSLWKETTAWTATSAPFLFRWQPVTFSSEIGPAWSLAFGAVWTCWSILIHLTFPAAFGPHFSRGWIDNHRFFWILWINNNSLYCYDRFFYPM